ncbi:MAG: septal ring lytic transglycosylase RlpA family protein [Gammaproteobacteria bacterium]|nr:septal ring lytic transglycosylase RlpA family protein [Gammaproteobacteria bacterium]
MRLQSYNNAYRLLLLTLSAMLASCAVRDGAPESYDRDWRSIDDATPVVLPFSRYGNPDTYEVFGQTYQVMASNDGFSEKGLASWYGTKFHGRRTSSGEPYDMYAMTAAHKSLRIPSYVEVTNLSNNRKAIVKVNDRGPFHEGRVIDLSYAAATKLGVAETGTAPVTLRVIEAGQPVINDVPVTDTSTEKTVLENKDRDNSAIADFIDAPFEEQVGKKIYVHVAAFASEGSAMSMLDYLKSRHFKSVRIHVENKQQNLLYRVRIGPVPSSVIAEKLVSQLKEINRNNLKTVTYN